jgi:hypothetical protein
LVERLNGITVWAISTGFQRATGKHFTLVKCAFSADAQKLPKIQSGGGIGGGNGQIGAQPPQDPLKNKQGIGVNAILLGDPRD